MEQVHELAPTEVRARSVRRDLDRIARTLEAAADGDFSARVRLHPSSPLWRIAAAADGLIARNAQISREFNRVCRRVAVDGQLSERAHVSNLGGQYASSLSTFNELLDQLTWHAAETGAVARALEQGELGRTMPLQAPDGAPLRREALRVARSMNALVSRLRGIRGGLVEHEPGPHLRPPAGKAQSRRAGPHRAGGARGAGFRAVRGPVRRRGRGERADAAAHQRVRPSRHGRGRTCRRSRPASYRSSSAPLRCTR